MLPPLFSTPIHSAHSPPPSPLNTHPHHLPNKPSVTHTQQHQTTLLITAQSSDNSCTHHPASHASSTLHPSTHHLLLISSQPPLNQASQIPISHPPTSPTKAAQTAAQTGATLTSMMGSSRNPQVLSAGSWSGLRALPWSLHGARNGTHLSPVTHSAKVRPTRQTR